MPRINIYCDESCHLENDHTDIMVIGGVWHDDSIKKRIKRGLQDIKKKYNRSMEYEFKWTNISSKSVQMYIDVIDLFFDTEGFNFRCIYLLNKSKLDHEKYNQSHDEFYNKTFYTMLQYILDKDLQSEYKILIDIKDTYTADRVKKLQTVLRNKYHDTTGNIVKQVLPIESHRVPQVQIADLLIGATGYAARGLKSNDGKLEVIRHIEKRSGKRILQRSTFANIKFNTFNWDPMYRRA